MEIKDKKCTRCKELKPVTDFHRRAGKTQRKSRCKDCTNEVYRLRQYHNTKVARATKKVWQSKRREQLRKIAIEAKSKPCQDCGNSFHYAAMDFDHREEGEKAGNISLMVQQTRTTFEALLAEIAKCDVVCANCHRVRTWNRAHAVIEEAAA